MVIDRDTFISILDNLSEEKRDYILSDEVTDHSFNLAELFSIPDEKRAIWGRIIGLYLAGSVSNEELPITFSEALSVSKEVGVAYAGAIISTFSSPKIPEKKHEKPVDAEIMEHFSKPKNNQTPTPTRVEDIGNKRQIVNPFSDQQDILPVEERVISEKEMEPIIKPVVIPKGSVVPSFEESARAEQTEPQYAEQAPAPNIDMANRMADGTYRGRDPYREPPE